MAYYFLGFSSRQFNARHNWKDIKGRGNDRRVGFFFLCLSGRRPERFLTVFLVAGHVESPAKSRGRKVPGSQFVGAIKRNCSNNSREPSTLNDNRLMAGYFRPLESE